MLYIECDPAYVTITGVEEGNMTFGGNFTTLAAENGYKVLWSNDTNNTRE